MSGICVNHWATLIAAAAAMVIGAFWYSPLAFGKVWMKLSGITSPKGAVRGYIIGFISTIVMSYALSIVVDIAGAITPLSGAKVGAFIWLGFVATVNIGTFLWEGKSFLLYLINVGYYLVAFMVMGAIVAVCV
jgi:hypothetical protein